MTNNLFTTMESNRMPVGMARYFGGCAAAPRRDAAWSPTHAGIIAAEWLARKFSHRFHRVPRAVFGNTKRLEGKGVRR